MENKFLESSEFYNSKFNNFSTIIIVPIAIMVVLVFFMSLFMEKEVSINTIGIIGNYGGESTAVKHSRGSSLSSTIHEGDKLRAGQIIGWGNKNRPPIKAPISGLVHIDPNGEVSIFTPIQFARKLSCSMYLRQKDLSLVRRNQSIRLTIQQNSDKPIIMNGKLRNISVVPVQSKNGPEYNAIGYVKVNKQNAKRIKYGMNGEISIISKKETYFNYFENKLLDTRY
ncbi:HlyD family efflux transporter periplasmic adaptor subunit [Companilactobacillus mishanensis]|uniref:HlyD family efflux transporter periplasmic adaptor subunit n=1 Tax=Companilactobacillus mishanensis TaxID=2486008 RepID=A0A5P0ZIR4_9LACO|nr:HlyD family efflux transporter periplasmic adaptor subunit [Companilactobacillus mishanensis]MQS52922.1 HlyD family efflux transporter periplasmic adaptor subunit [Companilactobacillus mishanensis]